jgi:hypothetical protein
MRFLVSSACNQQTRQVKDLPFIEPHEFRYKGFEMEDNFLLRSQYQCCNVCSKSMAYASSSDSVLVERTPLHHICLQGIIDLWHELECESLPAL